jgi:hypothetical protein
VFLKFVHLADFGQLKCKVNDIALVNLWRKQFTGKMDSGLNVYHALGCFPFLEGEFASEAHSICIFYFS